MTKAVDLLDVNVWLALGLPDHPHHGRALLYWNNAMGERAAFCRITALGMVRLLTNPTVMGGAPFSVGEAWAAYRQFMALPEVYFAVEPEGLEEHLAELVAAESMTPGLWTDAYLAAFAVSAGLRVVSFDKDFHRFQGLSWFQPCALAQSVKP